MGLILTYHSPAGAVALHLPVHGAVLAAHRGASPVPLQGLLRPHEEEVVLDTDICDFRHHC